MKHLSLEPFRNWFGYTRRERRSSFLLIIIIAAVGGIRYIVPPSKEPLEIVTLELPARAHDTVIQKKPVSVRQNYTTGTMRKEPVQVIELNTCDSAALEALPGIGPVLSVRIIKYRNLLGGYATVDQLREVYGLTEETFNMIKERVKADPSLISKININTVEYRYLIRLPYLEKYEVSAIIKYRELKGKIENIDELVKNKILTEEKVERLKWYVEY